MFLEGDKVRVEAVDEGAERQAIPPAGCEVRHLNQNSS